MHDISTLTVGLGTRAYDISVGRGLIARADDLIGAFLNDRHVVVISDSNVAPVHLPTLMTACARVGRRCDTIEVPAGESSKSMPVLAKLLEDILALGVDRGVVLVALGGGVIGDLVGFAAASLLRGVDFIQVPTTLLAQVDSSVGGKTGVNAAAASRLVIVALRGMPVSAQRPRTSRVPAGGSGIAQATFILSRSALAGPMIRS